MRFIQFFQSFRSLHLRFIKFFEKSCTICTCASPILLLLAQFALAVYQLKILVAQFAFAHLLFFLFFVPISVFNQIIVLQDGQWNKMVTFTA